MLDKPHNKTILIHTGNIATMPENTNIIHIQGKQNLVSVIKQAADENQALLIDYWAEWCGPCKMIAPLLEDMSEHYKDKLLIAKIDIEAEGNQEIAVEANVRSIPTLTINKNAEQIGMHIGTLSKLDMMHFIDQAMD